MTGRIVCFGELLLRLAAPGRELLLQSPRLDVHVGGAEANVAVSLARFGHDVAMVSAVPRNALGIAAVGELRRHGVDTRGVAFAPGRMGLYFLATGAIQRPSEVLYDRAGSAFALAPADFHDWDALLRDAGTLHVSGVSPALGPAAAAATLRAVRMASERGLTVSFDGNYRPKLWAAWDADAPAILRGILAHVDLLFADHRDIAVVLGRDFDALPATQRTTAAAQAAFAAFPRLRRMATTVRTQHSVDHHELSAQLITREHEVATQAHSITPIVDRIGAGDAFAAGLLHGLRSGQDEAESLRFGLACACLKHSIPGDFNLAGIADVEAFLGERRFDVRR